MRKQRTTTNVKLYTTLNKGNNIMFGNLLTTLEPKPVKESRKLIFNILEDEKINYEQMRNTIGKTPTRFARKLDQNLKLSSSIFVASLVSVFLMVSGLWFYLTNSVANVLSSVVSDTNISASISTGLIIISLIVFVASVLIGGFASFFLLRNLIRSTFSKNK